MSNLSSLSVFAIYQDADDETKMNAIVDLTKDVHWNTFVNHPVVKMKFVERVCAMVDEIDLNKKKLKPGQPESFNFMLRNSELTIDEIVSMFHEDYLMDMLIYVNPIDWKWYKILHHSDGNNYIVVFKNKQGLKDEKPFDFHKDVMNGTLDPKKILKVSRFGENLLSWYNFF